MDSLLVVSPLAALLLWLLYRRFQRTTIEDIPGPQCDSFLLGHSPELTRDPCGVPEFKWQEKFGNVFKIKGSFGENVLFLADPKSLHHVMQASPYGYKRVSGQRVISALVMDRGLLWADGDVHKRQKRAILPAFSVPEIRAFLPIFLSDIEKIAAKWQDMIHTGPSGQSAIVNVHYWLSKAALDSIGTAAFEYNFGSIDNMNNPLTKSYENMLVAGFGSPSAMKILFENVQDKVPLWILEYVYDYLPGDGIRKLKENQAEVHRVSQQLLKNKQEAHEKGVGKKDLMSLLVKSNASENASTKLRDDEIIPQMRSFMFAGHESTSNTISWAIYELAMNPHMQTRMREEVRSVWATVSARGDTEWKPADLDAMPYTTAIMKETLRLYPIGFRMIREASEDDVIPLSTPIHTSSGKVINEIPIAKGTRLWIAVDAYNVNKDVWGEDSHTFNPDRWLATSTSDKKMSSLGVYANLLTFSAGTRHCIGWRFALVEMQAFLITLIPKFEFSIPEGSTGIRRNRSGLMTPQVVGEEDAGSQLPLKIKLISD